VEPWSSPARPLALALRGRDWWRIVPRGTLLVLVIFSGLGVLLALRLLERPVFGLRRPVTPFITQAVCRITLVLIGLRLVQHGAPMTQRGALVANHASWLDIFALNAAERVYFVSKDDVAHWPVIGWLARATGTVFIRRHGRDAARQKLLFEARLRAGHRLLFFPEGTSTDGQQVLGFKSTLFSAFFADGLAELLHVQPVSIVYHPPPGQDPRMLSWWGDMDFTPHFLAVLANARGGTVDLVFHTPHAVADYPHRKALAAVCEADVRAGHAARSAPLRACE